MQDGLANAGPDPHQVQDVGRLELAHNGCVDALRRLLSKRLELVQLMFGTDTLEADWEQAQCTPHAAQCTPHVHAPDVHRMWTVPLLHAHRTACAL